MDGWSGGEGQDSGDARLAGGGRSSRTMCQARERERERLVSNPHIVTNKKELQKNTVTSTPPLQLTVANTKQQLKDAKKKTNIHHHHGQTRPKTPRGVCEAAAGGRKKNSRSFVG